jgi:hypothetical protein
MALLANPKGSIRWAAAWVAVAVQVKVVQVNLVAVVALGRALLAAKAKRERLAAVDQM